MRFFYFDYQIHTLMDPIYPSNSSFTFDFNKAGHEKKDFLGWLVDGIFYKSGDHISLKGNTIIIPVWK